MLIYAEDFSSPQHSGRFGCDAVKAAGRWYPEMVPYAESGGVSVSSEPGIAGNTDLDSGRFAQSNMTLFLPRSRSLTAGFLLGAPSNMNVMFLSFLDNSGTNVENFRVTISLSNDNQQANVTFLTGGDHPAIPDQAIYYDFNQPLWFWVQCDMPAHMDSAPIGTCRVWLNNDLMVTRENIFTGNVDLWAGQELYKYNNAVRIYSDSDVLSVAAVNEGLGYLDSALGDINIAGLLPETAETSQWYTHHDGLNLETPPEEIMLDNLHTDYADLHMKAHIRADDHMVQSMFKHQNPFSNDAHIMAVAHRIVHRKHDIAGDTNLRVEPIIHTSGRDPLMDRGKGQVSGTSARTLFVNYTTPYAGAFWNKEILDLTKFGFAYFDAARPTQVDEQVDLFSECDTVVVPFDLYLNESCNVADSLDTSESLNESCNVADSLDTIESLVGPNSFLDLFCLAHVSDDPDAEVPNTYVHWLSEILSGCVYWEDGLVHGDGAHISDLAMVGEEA